jgi:hypothetical protein
MKVTEWIAEYADALEPLVSYALHHAGEDDWDHRLRDKRVHDLTADELWLLRDFNAAHGGNPRVFMKMCLPWIPARSGEQDTDEMRVSELVCILQYAHTAAIGQMLFERRENKNATPADCVSDFLTGFFTRPRR